MVLDQAIFEISSITKWLKMVVTEMVSGQWFRPEEFIIRVWVSLNSEKNQHKSVYKTNPL
jgi:hypothetical protein